MPSRPGQCKHPKDQRTKIRNGKVTCLVCQKTFTPPGQTSVRHGTYRGYDRHRRRREGQWCWPIGDECGCKQAGIDFQREQASRPENRQRTRKRGAARQRALAHLARTYPSVYATYYAEEMAGTPAPFVAERIPDWDDLLRRLVKEAMGQDEATLAGKVQAKLASPQEATVMRLVRRLRVMLAAPDSGAW